VKDWKRVPGDGSRKSWK